MKSLLHLVSVFLSCILYFSPVFNGAELLLKYHFKSVRQETASISTKHFKLMLEKTVAETSDELTVGFLGQGPELIKKYINY